MIHTMEKQQPLWTPGTAHGYHALTYGWLAGELVRRANRKNRTLSKFIQEEIANPLGIEFYIGLSPDKEYRVSHLDVKSNENGTLYEGFNSNETHHAEIPAANGITNARSVARLFASLIGDVEDKKYKQLLNEQILKQATKSNTPDNEIDLVLNVPTNFSMGFILTDQIFPLLGPGGSIGFAAPAKNLSFAYVMNRMNTEIANDIDVRYKEMLNKIATMINNGNAANLGKNLSFYTIFFCTVIFYIHHLLQ